MDFMFYRVCALCTARQPNCFDAIAFKCTISIMHSFRTRTGIAASAANIGLFAISAAAATSHCGMNLLLFKSKDLMRTNSMVLRCQWCGGRFVLFCFHSAVFLHSIALYLYLFDSFIIFIDDKIDL